MTLSKHIKPILESVDGLKPMPGSVTSALKVIEEPDVTISEISSIIAKDQALAARILKFANSAYYGFPHPASTLNEAIARLGFRRIKNILFTLSYSSMLGRRIAGYNLGHGELWRHSIAVAMTCQRISERVAYSAPDEAYVAGLLHDIGKLLLDQYFKVDWAHLLSIGQENNLTLIEAEENLLGINHAQTGGELARNWGLPTRLSDAIAYHHTPALATWPDLAAIVQVADIICWRLNIGLTHPDFLPEPAAVALELLSLSLIDIDEMTDIYSDMLNAALISDTSLVSVTH